MDDSQDTTFTTFNDPPSLFDAVSQTLNGSTSTLPTHIRVCIMAPLDGKTLTETELNGGIDGPDCPNLEHLVEEWRTSFRQIPQGHSITHLQFDMSTPQEMELRHIVRMLQALSTVVNIKAAPPQMNFSICGCSDTKRKYLEGSFPSRDKNA
ncbi:hypothetical protein VE00_08299 [Pseudogymnoascus sp. WSF 3629]|nr:hypothetical protein VE00_08299 [Pseudogymnoascus sp. WSF 3629]